MTFCLINITSTYLFRVPSALLGFRVVITFPAETVIYQHLHASLHTVLCIVMCLDQHVRFLTITVHNTPATSFIIFMLYFFELGVSSDGLLFKGILLGLNNSTITMSWTKIYVQYIHVLEDRTYCRKHYDRYTCCK